MRGCREEERPERFSIETTRERWLAFLPFEHATLPAPIDYGREAGEMLVFRAPSPRRTVAHGRVPAEHGPALFLQAAAVVAALHAAGTSASAADLLDAAWDVEDGVARLWLVRTPAGVAEAAAAAPASAVLGALLERLFRREGRVRLDAAAALLRRLAAPEAPWRRPEFWVAEAFRSFPALAEERQALARERTAGSFRASFRTAFARVRIEKGRAILTGGEPRFFPVGAAPLEPGAAVGLAGSSGAAAARELRLAAGALRLAEREPAPSRRSVWICLAMDRWDAVSRRAVEIAAPSAEPPVEIVRISDEAPPPTQVEEWRSAIYVPCGTVRAGLRYSEAVAELFAREPLGMPAAALRRVRDPGWASYVADATGDAALPVAEAAPPRERGTVTADPPLTPAERRVVEALAVLDGPPERADLEALFPGPALSRALRRLGRRSLVELDASGRPRLCRPESSSAVTSDVRRAWLRRWADAAGRSGRRVALLLDAGDTDAAVAAGRDWMESDPGARPERWFELSARLAARVSSRPPWLDALEAERELAGGRPAEAEDCLRRAGESPSAAPGERRAFALRLAEVAALRGRSDAAADRAGVWRRANPDAPAHETSRALRLEAAGLSRRGDPASALDLLQKAEAPGDRLPPAERVEICLARAAVLSRAGRFAEEEDAYACARRALGGCDDDAYQARILAAEALGLSDRRAFDAAVARLERAIEILRDDAVERAKVTIDLAATLHHAGRGVRAAALLQDAVRQAVAAGREDLARLARSNLVEEELDRCRWESAAPVIEELLSGAERDGDAVWKLVALHHRARLALRRGWLEDAERDNREARELARRLGDRLEIGELWLEEGDRAALAGDPIAARDAWTRAAADPPDRCDSAERAVERLAEMDAFSAPVAPAERLARARDAIERGEYAAAEAVARWARLFPDAVSPALAAGAGDLLRSAGGERLAAVAFSSGEPPRGDTGAMRRLREIVAAALEGETRDADLPFGIRGLAIAARGGEEILRLGAVDAAFGSRRALQAGSVEYDLHVSPPMEEGALDAAALVVETLLFRPRAASAAAGEFAGGWGRFGVITGDSSMEEPYRRLVRFAPRAMTVLVLGESGSGKEAAARAVHALSPRAGAPFVGLNVSAIPAALVESELFGHARGAFTGADRDRPGLLEAAAGGTIFFDEIGDLAAPVQSKLLRALQDREIRRVGENRSRRIDVRVVSATSLDLAREVEAGRFREDLYYRLHVAVVRLPPLRERGRDVVLLARLFLAQCAREFARPARFELAPEATAALLAHSWPGNVRELQSALASAAALSEGVRVEVAALPEAVRRAAKPAERGGGYRSRVNAHRRGLIMEALDRAGGNRSRAARDLKLSRQALLYLIRELNVTSPAERGAGARG